jgi:hypothetical protein
VLQVDARRDGDHPLDLRAVQVDQLARLVGGVGHQPVDGRDHLLLPDHPAQRLGASPSASARFFTLARVCAVCTSGTPQRSVASQPTCPDSQ